MALLLCWCIWCLCFSDYFERKEVEHKVKVEDARARNELYECGCCFEDECLFTEMNVCADGHLFCRQCIARSAEAAFGEGKTHTYTHTHTPPPPMHIYTTHTHTPPSPMHIYTTHTPPPPMHIYTTHTHTTLHTHSCMQTGTQKESFVHTHAHLHS